MTGNEKFRLKVVDDLRKNRVIVESDEEYITLLKKANKDLGDLVRERDAKLAASQAQIKVLREALERMRVAGGSQEFHMAWELAQEALATTPEQSLARYHNEVLEKAEKVCEQATTIGACIAAIRELKEPE